MLEKKHLKPGVLVWWTRSGDFQEWSVPCLVTTVSRASFRVRSLDDFKETCDLRMDDQIDPTSRREMRVCTMKEVEDFFDKRKLELEQYALVAKTELQKRERTRDTYTDNIKEFLTEHKPTTV